MPDRRFPPLWSVDDPDMKLGQDCFIVRDANGHALAYIYFEDEPGRQAAGAIASVSVDRHNARACESYRGSAYCIRG
jgi:hypothetical protein